MHDDNTSVISRASVVDFQIVYNYVLLLKSNKLSGTKLIFQKDVLVF